MIELALLTAPAPADEITGGHRYDAEMLARATRHGVRMRVVAISGKTVVGRALASRRALQALGGVDAIVVDSIVAAPLALAGPAPRPLVGLVHQIPASFAASPLDRAADGLARALYRRCELVVAVSDWASSRLRSLGVPLAVVAPGVDPARRSTPKSNDVAQILCVANWLPHKGILELAAAVSRLPDGAGVLHLVGATRAATRYGRRVAERLARDDLRARVVAHGTLRGDALAAAFAGADVFALPSRGEAYGIAFAEALANGLPIVACHSGNVPALVAAAGTFVDPGDVEGLAWALALLIGDAERREELAAAARTRAATLPSWDESASAFFSAIRSGTHFAPRLRRDDRDRAATSA